MSAADWRPAAAAALEAQAAVLVRALAGLDEAHAVLERLGRDRPCTELRATAATLRAEITDLTSQARSLRATPAGDGGFPMPLTTRHVRGELR